MKADLQTIWLATLLFVVSAVSVSAAESITTFAAEYEIQPDATVEVTEFIDYDFGTADQRGILRTLNTTHAQDATAWWKRRTVDVEILSVLRGGQAEPFTITETTDGLLVRIGNPNMTITGSQTYEIKYRLNGALSYDAEATELYWQVTGTDWSVPITSVVATVRTAAGVVMRTDERACYQGSRESTVACDRSDVTGSNGVQFASAALAAHEGLTIAVALDPATVSTVVRETSYYALFAIPPLVGWFIVLFWLVYRFRTKDSLSWPLVAQYEPYQDKPPMYTGYLFDKVLQPRDISAGIVYLAEQGFIHIERNEVTTWRVFTGTDYSLTLRKPASEAPNIFLTQVLELLFTDPVPPRTALLSELKKHQTAISRQITKLQSAFKSELDAAGYTTTQLPAALWQWGKLTVVIAVALLVTAIVLGGGWIIILMCFVIGTVIAYSIAVQPRFTRAGHEAYQHIRGFKHFMEMTDKERFAFHNAPAKNPQQFMEYLPYAVALGVEKEWAKVFADVTIPTPEWYSAPGQSVFSASVLTQELSSFSSAVATSGATGSTGSSGGGSVGGGGGGGGGGSW